MKLQVNGENYTLTSVEQNHSGNRKVTQLFNKSMSLVEPRTLISVFKTTLYLSLSRQSLRICIHHLTFFR
jgi:hypothetical protein